MKKINTGGRHKLFHESGKYNFIMGMMCKDYPLISIAKMLLGLKDSFFAEYYKGHKNPEEALRVKLSRLRADMVPLADRLPNYSVKKLLEKYEANEIDPALEIKRLVALQKHRIEIAFTKFEKDTGVLTKGVDRAILNMANTLVVLSEIEIRNRGIFDINRLNKSIGTVDSYECARNRHLVKNMIASGILIEVENKKNPEERLFKVKPEYF